MIRSVSAFAGSFEERVAFVDAFGSKGNNGAGTPSEGREGCEVHFRLTLELFC